MDTCTVTAPDVITAFAVPSPGIFSQSPPVFSGLVTRRLTPPSRSPSLLRIGHIVYANPFSRRRELKYKCYPKESMPVFGAIVEEIVEIRAEIAKDGREQTILSGKKRKKRGPAKGKRGKTRLSA